MENYECLFKSDTIAFRKQKNEVHLHIDRKYAYQNNVELDIKEPLKK